MEDLWIQSFNCYALIILFDIVPWKRIDIFQPTRPSKVGRLLGSLIMLQGQNSTYFSDFYILKEINLRLSFGGYP